MSDADYMDENPEPTGHLKTEDGVLVRKLYIGNVPAKVNKSELLNIFEQFGKVQNVYIKKPINGQATNAYNGRYDTFAFITYYEAESATKALCCNRTIILKYKKLKVRPADTWHQPVEQLDGSILFDKSEIKEKGISTSPSIQPNSQQDDDSLLGAVGGVAILPNKAANATDCNASTIDKLNDYCLLHIFSFLSIFDHLILEKVSQRWSGIVQNGWNNRSILDIDKLIKKKEVGELSFTTDMLRKLLLRFGINLKSIKLTTTSHKFNSRTHRVIAQYCKNLEILDLSGIATTANSISFIARNCHKLKKIYFKDVSGIHDQVFDELFVNNKNLESVNLDRNFAMTGKCLRSLTPGLKELKLNHCNSLKLVDLKSGLEKFKSLELLSLDSCVTLTTNVLTEIVKRLPNLKSLSLNNYYPLMNDQSLTPLKELKQLRSLSLSMNQAVNNKNLEVICNSCQELEVLDISGSGLEDFNEEHEALSVNPLLHLAKLSNLKELTVSYMDIVSEDSIKAVAVKGLLRILRVRGCPFFDDKASLQLLKNCPNLNFLDMSGCEKISGETIVNANNILNLQPDRSHKLKFVIGGTSIDLEEHQLHSMLDISTANLSLSHLRPDFYDDYFPSEDEEYDIEDLDFDDYYDADDLDFHHDFENFRQFMDIASDFDEDDYSGDEF